jgi:hypothetical protein
MVGSWRSGIYSLRQYNCDSISKKVCIEQRSDELSAFDRQKFQLRLTLLLLKIADCLLARLRQKIVDLTLRTGCAIEPHSLVSAQYKIQILLITNNASVVPSVVLSARSASECCPHTNACHHCPPGQHPAVAPSR